MNNQKRSWATAVVNCSRWRVPDWLLSDTPGFINKQALCKSWIHLSKTWGFSRHHLVRSSNPGKFSTTSQILEVKKVLKKVAKMKFWDLLLWRHFQLLYTVPFPPQIAAQSAAGFPGAFTDWLDGGRSWCKLCDLQKAGVGSISMPLETTLDDLYEYHKYYIYIFIY